MGALEEGRFDKWIVARSNMHGYSATSAANNFEGIGNRRNIPAV